MIKRKTVEEIRELYTRIDECKEALVFLVGAKLSLLTTIWKNEDDSERLVVKLEKGFIGEAIEKQLAKLKDDLDALNSKANLESRREVK